MLNLMVLLLVPVHDPPATEVVGTELYDDPVVRQDADVVHPHFPADMSENLVPVVQLHPEEGIRERLDNRAFDLNSAVWLVLLVWSNWPGRLACPSWFAPR